jgi:hypothetical protein
MIFYRALALSYNTSVMIIQDLIIFTHTTRFEMEYEQLAFIRSLTIHEEGESDEISEEIEGFKPISDTKEDKVDKEVSV